MRKINWLLIHFLFLIYSANTWAVGSSVSPVGMWTTIDDVTHTKRSIVQIWQNNGVYYGKILKVYSQPGDTGFCKKCSGSLKNKPILDLRIIWDVKQTGENEWSQGYILDPKSGNTYRVRFTLSSDNKLLNVRGYIGIPLLGRTQTWLRNS